MKMKIKYQTQAPSSSMLLSGAHAFRWALFINRGGKAPVQAIPFLLPLQYSMLTLLPLLYSMLILLISSSSLL